MSSDAETKKKVKKEVKRALEEEKPASRLRQKKAEDKKRRRKQIAMVLGLVVFGYIFYLLFVPYKGGLNFGACKVFLQLHVRFPHTLRLSTVEDFGDSFRIWYAYTDTSGQYRMDRIQCYYRPDPEMGFALDRVTINRRPVEQEIVERFNKSIPVIKQNPPDLTLPQPIPDSLQDMEIDTDSFRESIF